MHYVSQVKAEYNHKQNTEWQLLSEHYWHTIAQVSNNISNSKNTPVSSVKQLIERGDHGSILKECRRILFLLVFLCILSLTNPDELPLVFHSIQPLAIIVSTIHLNDLLWIMLVRIDTTLKDKRTAAVTLGPFLFL